MTPRSSRLAAMLLTLAVIINSCTPAPGQSVAGRESIGQLGTVGSAVFVNGAPSSTGTTIFSGDSVTTGPGSSAVILFANGGYIQLDQNTDPFFSWQTIEDVRCILVRMASGQAYEDNTPACIGSPAADALAHSVVNIQVSPSGTVFTLLTGNLMLTRPVRLSLTPGQEIAAQAGNARVRLASLSPSQLAGRLAWRSRFPVSGWCSGNGFVQPARLGDCRGGFSFTRSEPTVQLPPPIQYLPSIRFPPTGQRPPPTVQPPPAQFQPPPPIIVPPSVPQVPRYEPPPVHIR